MTFEQSVVFCIGYIVIILFGIKLVVSLIFEKPKHRHKLDPQDMVRIDENTVEWTCWDCGEKLSAICGVDICASHDVVKRPNRKGSLWGEPKQT